MVTHDGPNARGALRISFARSAQAPGIEVVRYRDLTREWRSIPESYTCFTMAESLHGNVDVMARGVRAQFEPRSVVMGEPGEPWVLRPWSRMRGDFRVVRVDHDLCTVLGEQITPKLRTSGLPRGPQRDLTVARAFSDVYRAVERGERLAVDQRLVTLFAVMAAGKDRRLPPTAAVSRLGVEPARELLHARFAEQISLDELAAAAGVDKFVLLRAFSQQFGMTPHAYQVQLRVARAYRLIRKGVRLADAASAVGYSEQSALNRVFKKRVGTTPGEYARSFR